MKELTMQMAVEDLQMSASDIANHVFATVHDKYKCNVFMYNISTQIIEE
jgi:hypothetical protein